MAEETKDTWLESQLNEPAKSQLKNLMKYNAIGELRKIRAQENMLLKKTLITQDKINEISKILANMSVELQQLKDAIE